jgi:hypothetical protein
MSRYTDLGAALGTQADAEIDAGLVRESTLRARVAELEAIIDPPPPPPPPPPEPEVWDAAHSTEPYDVSGSLMFTNYHLSSRYERWNRCTVLSAARRVEFHNYDLASGGTRRALPAGTYTLLVQDAAGATINSQHTYVQPEGSPVLVGGFDVDPAALPSGWLIFDIQPPTTLPALRHAFYVAGAAITDRIPALNGSYELSKGRGPHLCWVPPRFTPAPFPVAPRTYEPFDTAISRAGLFRENLVPCTDGSIWRPCKTRDGIWTTGFVQSYHWNNFVKAEPVLPQLSGPRGRGNVAAATHLQVAFNGDILFLTPWRFGRVDHKTGAVRTIAGWEHPEPVYYEDAGHGHGKVLKGDWSRVAGAKGLHEAWGFAWDGPSVTVPPDTPLDASPSPHLADPVVYVADSQNNRVLRMTFDRMSHATPVVVEEVATFEDPWDIAYVPSLDKFVVSERGRHALVLMDRAGNKEDFLVGEALAYVNASRFVVRTGTLAQCQAATIVLPEGVVEQDGWIYWGSMAQGQIKRINVATREVQVVGAPTIDTNSNYVKIAISDGTFGPRGTVFATTWSVATFGYPRGFVPQPDGTWTLWSIATTTGTAAAVGKGGTWSSLLYGSAMAVGGGKLVCSSAEEGLIVVSKALPSDVAINTTIYQAGKKAWEAAGHHITHGRDGFGFYGLPWPELTDDMRYYLTSHGHAV